MKKSNLDISSFRQDHDWSSCNLKYYDSLDFLDLFQDHALVSRKKSKPFSEIESSRHYSIGYFNGDGKLMRIDEAGDGSIPAETYLIWEQDILKEAHSFRLGYRWGEKISNSIDRQSSWFYTYQKGLLIKIVWLNYEDRKYGDSDEIKVSFDYEYDEKGIRYIHKTIEGKGKLWKKPDIFVLYDREKEKYLKECTVSKTPLIGKSAKRSDNVISFARSNAQKTAICKKCKRSLTFIATVNLGDKRLNTKNINFSSSPIFFCFDCLIEQEYDPNSLVKTLGNSSPFTEELFKFSRTSDEGQLENAFLKIGGQPDWIQNDEHPACTTCNNKMKFIIEIQTIEDLSNGSESLAFGDNGKLYVFACCNNIKCIPQWS